MRKYFIVYALTLLAISCGQQTKDDQVDLGITDRLVEAFVIKPPPPILGYGKIYIKVGSDSALECTLAQLPMIHSKSKQKNTLPEFIRLVLNTAISINTSSIDDPKTFAINPIIKRDFEKHGLDSFLLKYCQPFQDNFILKRKNLSISEIKSVSYLLFSSKYLRLDDDYNSEITYKPFHEAFAKF